MNVYGLRRENDVRERHSKFVSHVYDVIYIHIIQIYSTYISN